MRVRFIKPGYFANDRLAELPPLDRILFAGLWILADREGRLEDRPARIKAQILPYDMHDVNVALERLSMAGFIIRYEVDGNKLICIPSWHDHQRPHKREQGSRLPGPNNQPAPNDVDSTTKAVSENDLSNDEQLPRQSFMETLTVLSPPVTVTVTNTGTGTDSGTGESNKKSYAHSVDNSDSDSVALPRFWNQNRLGKSTNKYVTDEAIMDFMESEGTNHER